MKRLKEEKIKQLKKLEDIGNKSIKEKWKIIKSFTGDDKSNNNNEPCEKISNDKWVSFFRNLGFSDDVNKSPLPTSMLESVKNLTEEDKTNMTKDLNREITVEEILETTNKLKNNKAVGFDNISNEVIKVFVNLKLGSKIITSLFNSLFGTYQESWKHGLVKPIFKNGDQTNPKNYRGITLTSCLGKLFNQILNARLVKNFEYYNIFADNLMGFRPEMRTLNNVFVLKNLIDKSFSKKEKLFCCFVDFSKAFDRVWRKGLLHKLECYGVDGKMLSTIKNLYTSTENQIILNKTISEKFEINMGVKQGDPLSSFLFNVEMNELCAALAMNQSVDAPSIKDKKIPCLLWADDVVLISKSEAGLKNSIKKLEEYCNQWKMLVNTDKTKVMIFNRVGKKLKN